MLVWPGAKDEPVYRRVDEALIALVKRAGGSYVKNPLAGTMMGAQPATAHPLGGCGIGRDRASGVVNHKSQVFDASGGERRRAPGPLRDRWLDHAALAGRQPLAHHHRPRRARARAHAPRPRPQYRAIDKRRSIRHRLNLLPTPYSLLPTPYCLHQSHSGKMSPHRLLRAALLLQNALEVDLRPAAGRSRQHELVADRK